MVTQVLSAPAAPDTPPPIPWTGLTMLWQGDDGLIWDLTTGQYGLCMLPGIRGLTMPPITHHKGTSAAVPGSLWRGYTTTSREVFWPIQVFADPGSEAWILHDRAFWNTMHPGKTGVWSVIQPSGEKRTLLLRFRDDGNQAFSQDPTTVGWTNYGITFDADQPYWRGDTITKSWKGDSSTDFFDPTPGNLFRISSGSRASNAKIDNFGDVEVYPVWRVYGPTTSVSLGIGGRTISIPFAVDAGDVLTIDTDPRALTAMLNGVDKVASLQSSDFAPLPSGRNIPLAISMAGTGTVEMSFTPLYFRAW